MKYKTGWLVLAVWLGIGAICSAASRPPPSFTFSNTADPLRALRQTTNGDWQLDLAPVPGKVYAVEVSTNQIHWTQLGGFVTRSGRLRWTDSGSREWPLRFYRVVPRGFSSIRHADHGPVELTLGVRPGPEYVLETSSNLLDWTPWTRFMSRSPILRLNHAPPAGADRLFYRARATGSNSLNLQPDGSYVLSPTQTWGVAYLLETSTNLQDWSTVQRFIGTNSMLQFSGTAAAPQFAYRVQSAPVNDVYDAFIILGQSNAVGVGDLANREPSDPSVWIFGNDYQFKIAYEPVDDSDGQVDLVSRDPTITTNATYGHSWSLRAAKGITAAQGNQIVLIPCATGGTLIEQWMPGTNRYDRSTLFGSANYRRSIAASGGLKGIWYYGHESNSEAPYGSNYVADWTALIGELRRDYGPVPVIYVQLAMNTNAFQDRDFQMVAEMQRQMETGCDGTNALPDHFMVVAFDLPLQDYVHLSRAGVNTLADRIALATRQHIYGEDVNGTGPRLVSITHPGSDKSKINVQFSRPINQAFNNYDNQFHVFDVRAPDIVIEAPIRRVERDMDPTAVLITLEAPASAQVEVTYGGSVLPTPGGGLPNVVKDADGLPAPRFHRVPAR